MHCALTPDNNLFCIGQPARCAGLPAVLCLLCSACTVLQVSQARERNNELKAQFAQLQHDKHATAMQLSALREQYERQRETNDRIRLDNSFAKDALAVMRQRSLAGAP